MRPSIAALAVIRRRNKAGADEWLTIFNEETHALTLVGGPPQPGESFRAEHPHTKIVRGWLQRNDPEFREPSA